MLEPTEVKKYYEWKEGFWNGTVECYLCDADDKIFFESGRSVQKERIEIELREVPEEYYTSKTSEVESIQNQQEEWMKLLGNEDKDLINQVNTQLNPNAPVSAPTPPPVEKSPIQIILEKQKKKEVKQVNITLNIEIPTTKVIELLTVMFDEDEVYEEIISQSVSNFNVEDLRNLIQDSIIKSIKEPGE